MFHKVSVIVPNYNHAPYLKQRLDSIFNQTFQDFEVIILDDCSTDNSKEIIEQYRSNPKVSHIVYNETNSGSPFKQWAKGFELAQGEYIWIAESDDWAEPIFLTILTNALNENKSATIAYCNSIFAYPNHSFTLPFSTKDVLINGFKFVREHMSFQNIIYNASSVLFRKKNLLNISPKYSTFQACGDKKLWIDIALQGSVYYAHKQLNHFRQHNTNTTLKSIKSGISYREEHDIFDFLVSESIISKQTQTNIAIKYIREIRENKTLFASKLIFKQSMKLWRKTISLPTRIFLMLKVL